MLSRLTPTFAPFLFLLAACTVTSTETTPAPSGETTAEDPAGETETNGETESPDEESPGRSDEEAEPAAPQVVAKVILSGQFSKVDLTYGRAGQYIVLDMKGDASLLSTQPSSVPPSKIRVSTTTSYELLYPQQGACDEPPELTIEKGALHVELQRAGTPNGTISGCHFLGAGVKASDGGFQARLKNVPIEGGGTITELLVDIAGPKS